jgi:nitrate reductase assembly molybdenum cofactor insertion protein NarJ
MKNVAQYHALSNLFRYPREGYKKRVNSCAILLKQYYPEAYQSFLPFLEIIKHKTLFEIEELFGQTFHIQAICYLDVGYVLFGEDYKRGEFLVQIKNEQAKVNNECGEELADNLPNILTLMELLEDKEFLGELAVRVMIPALKLMLKEFETSRMALKTKVRKKKQKVIIQEDMKNKNAYQYVIQTALQILELDFADVSYDVIEVKPDLTSAFLPNCGTCATEHEPAKITDK